MPCWTVRRILIAATLAIGTVAAIDRPLRAQPQSARPLQRLDADHEKRMRWWREARFGMFIHWGLYAVPAGEYKGTRSKEIGEWIMSWANIPRAEYEPFASRFDPVKFNAAEWVRIAKDAGMKYIVITSKHHDGFSMFDSDVSHYDIVESTPYRKDPLKALSEESRKQGLKFAVYYSIMDWHHPSQYVKVSGKDETAGDHNTEMREGQKPAYVSYMKAQLKEIVTKYDPAVLWFDGEWVNWWTEEDGKDLYRYVRSLKPDILINNRVGKGRKGMQGLNKEDQVYAGDFGTPEQQIPPSGIPGVDWESCMTMNNTWGYKSYDDNWKPAETLIRNLIDTASKGGNYLLNVGPTADGVIPPPSVERLAGIGKWMKVNGESIYGTTAVPIQTQLPWGRATEKKGRLYLHVFDWPADGVLTVPGYTAAAGAAIRASLLANPKVRLTTEAGVDGLRIRVPASAPDPVATVIVIETK
jgi:alpha-L-fucosidase